MKYYEYTQEDFERFIIDDYKYWFKWNIFFIILIFIGYTFMVISLEESILFNIVVEVMIIGAGFLFLWTKYGERFIFPIDNEIKLQKYDEYKLKFSKRIILQERIKKLNTKS